MPWRRCRKRSAANSVASSSLCQKCCRCETARSLFYRERRIPPPEQRLSLTLLPGPGRTVAGLQQAVLTLHAASSPPLLTPLCQLSAQLQQLGLSAGFRWTGAVAAATLESAYPALQGTDYYCYGCLAELKHLAESCYWLDTRLCFGGTEKRQLSEQPSKNNWLQS